MSSGAQIDYAALAKQAGAISSAPAQTNPQLKPKTAQTAQVDYAALAKQAGSIGYTPANENAGPGEQIGYSGLKDIVPMEGESFADTMKRAIAYGKTLTPEDIQRQQSADLKLAPAVLAAAPALGFGGAAALTGTAALFGPETTTVAARDAAGRFIGGTVEQQGASLATQLLTKYGPPAVSWLAKHAAQSILTGAAGGATWALINHLMKAAEP